MTIFFPNDRNPLYDRLFRSHMEPYFKQKLRKHFIAGCHKSWRLVTDI